MLTTYMKEFPYGMTYRQLLQLSNPFLFKPLFTQPLRYSGTPPLLTQPHFTQPQHLLPPPPLTLVSHLTLNTKPMLLTLTDSH
jgi:hypothetical protein